MATFENQPPPLPPSVLEYRGPTEQTPWYEQQRLPESREAADLARLAVIAGTIALVLCWTPILPLIMAALSWDYGRQARRQAVGSNPPQRAMWGMVMGAIGIVPNLLLGLLLVVTAFVKLFA